MLGLRFNDAGRSGLRVLCLGAHCDDIEIGCGGTLLRLIQEHDNLSVCWAVFSSDATRMREAQDSAAAFLDGASEQRVIVKDFENTCFPNEWREIKHVVHDIGQEFAPDVVFTHCRHDLHQDHRVLCELAWNAFRDHLILEYEIPKYDGDLGAPNFFVPLDQPVCDRKVDAILATFASQQDKHWFTRETLTALMRLRGVECKAPSGYAEAFYARKAVL